MPVEQGSVDPRLHLAVLLLLEPPLVASRVRTVRIHFTHENEVIAVGSPKNAVGLGRQPRDLPRPASPGVGHPDLSRPATRATQRQALAFGRPPGQAVVSIQGYLPERSSRHNSCRSGSSGRCNPEWSCPRGTGGCPSTGRHTPIRLRWVGGSLVRWYLCPLYILCNHRYYYC